MSLHEELSISMNSLDMIPEDTTWQPRQGSESPQGEEEIDSPPGYREGTISQISVRDSVGFLNIIFIVDGLKYMLYGFSCTLRSVTKT